MLTDLAILAVVAVGFAVPVSVGVHCWRQWREEERAALRHRPVSDRRLTALGGPIEPDNCTITFTTLPTQPHLLPVTNPTRKDQP